jgi:hypothetical protein
MKENKITVKVSSKGKNFLKQMQINRIKLDLDQLTIPDCIDRIVDYFKNNNSEYLNMMKEVKVDAR